MTSVSKKLTSKVAPAEPKGEIFQQGNSSQLQMVEKSVQNIYAKLKQVACCTDQDWVENEWNIIEDVLKHRHYWGQRTKILEKLDEDDNYAPIHCAVRSNNYYVCYRLLHYHKCNVNLLGFDAQTPLHLAACSPEIEEGINDPTSIFHILLQQSKIKLDRQDNQKRTPLHHAIMRRHLHIARALRGRKAKTEIGDVQGATPVHYACRYLPYDDITNLFGPINIAQTDWKTFDGKTPLDWAVEYGNNDVVSKHLSYPYKKANPDEGARNVVHSVGAAPRHRTEVLSRIVFGKRSKDNNLYMACRQLNRRQMISDDLITNEAMQFQDDEGLTPLMIAVKYRRTEYVEKLLNSNQYDQNILKMSTYHSKRTILHICAELPCKREIEHKNDEKVAKIIDIILDKVKSSKLIFESDALGNTPLHICAQAGNVYMSEQLLSLSNQSSSGRTTTKSNSNGLKEGGILGILSIKNSNGLTPFHEVTENERVQIVDLMLRSAGALNNKIIEFTDEQCRTSLHMAECKGHAEIVDLLLANEANPNANDINEKTPLHEAAGQRDSDEENIQDRVKCINRLVEENSEVNALDIRQESSLHIACRYGSSSLVETLLEHGADILQINLTDFNCLEVAIEEGNKQVVKYLIEHDRIFELMRNAQIRDVSDCKKSFACCFLPYWQRYMERHKVDTPMRKLIISMHDMAYQILEKCTTTIGAERTEVHQQFFNYEFLEDLYAVQQWNKGNLKNNSESDNEPVTNEPYTLDYQTQVMDHPLFLMAKYDRFQLMAHPLSKHLVYNKFFGISFGIFLGSFVLYVAFLTIFTTFAMRTRHPAEYYNMTGFSFDYNLCENVTRAVEKSSINLKESADKTLKIAMYSLSALIFIKNLWSVIAFIRVDFFKTFLLLGEISTLVLGFIFMFDYSFQQNVLMRCPVQWQIGAFGLLIGYLALFYYIQYFPIIGLYVIMLKAIVIRFLLFLPVILVFICGFTLTFYMLFQNFDTFGNIAVSFVKIVMMSTGEIDYGDLMYDDNNIAYYKVAFIILTLFAITMVILITNLLIGLAVGETADLMKEAKNTRMDNLYELAAGMEILKLQLVFFYNISCYCCFIPPESYHQEDLTKQWDWWKKLKAKLLKSCAREADEDELEEPSDDNQTEKQISILEEVKMDLRKPTHPVTVVTKHQGQTKFQKGTRKFP